MTRWRQPVCPTTLGLSPAMNEFVTERVKDVAAEVGAPKGKCQSDVVIVFTSEPQKLLDSMRAKAPALLGFHYPAQLKRIATLTHPIQAWYTTATAGGDRSAGMGGLAASNLAGPIGAGEGPGGATIDDGCCGTPGGCAGSRLTECLSNQIVAVVVIADRKQVDERPIGPIADYIAMLVLSKVDLDGDCGELASIVNLMSPKCADDVRPDVLTGADIAFLKALYQINMTELMWAQQDSVADLMAVNSAGK